MHNKQTLTILANKITKCRKASLLIVSSLAIAFSIVNTYNLIVKRYPHNVGLL